MAQTTLNQMQENFERELAYGIFYSISDFHGYRKRLSNEAKISKTLVKVIMEKFGIKLIGEDKLGDTDYVFGKIRVERKTVEVTIAVNEYEIEILTYAHL